MTNVGQCMHTVQEMRCLDKFVQHVKADFAVGDFNLAVSSKASAGRQVITEISTPGVMRFLPALEYDDAQLREHCVSNVHSRGARQCFDMCLVPCTNAAFSVEFVAIPGDVAYLKSLQDFVAGDDVLQARHVVCYANRTLSDHKITLIKSW